MTDPVVITLGCRLNAFESEVMRRHASDAGLEGAVIVNTCAVTAEAVRQAVKTIRKSRRDHPNARLIVTGCAAQLEPERFAELIEVDHVIGNAEKLSPATWRSLGKSDAARIYVTDIMTVRETAAHFVDAFKSKTRALIQIQNGCDHRCTFCIIPYARGPSRSVPAGAIVEQINALTGSGVQEVVLTGVDMTSYGADLPGGMTLGRLVRHILSHVPDLKRLRLSSIDQVEVDEQLLTAIAEEPRLMPHFHLSMQSGDDLILKRMKRRHLRDDAISFCDKVRHMRSDVVFGADLIAGFPTETDAMFENTMRAVDDCGLTYLHVFPYSPRHGTPAAKMPQVDRGVVKERAARLREAGACRLAGYLAQQAGRRVEVLMENGGVGRTPQFAEVRFGANPSVLAAGTIVDARVTGVARSALVAELAA